MLEICLLGRFQVKVNGLPVEEEQWTRRSAKHLLKLLALAPRHQLHREQIYEYLWGEQDPEYASNNLNKAIHAARRALESNVCPESRSHFIVVQKQHVGLRAEGKLFVDVEEFERFATIALKTQDLKAGETASELYKGDLLPEELYEDWAASRRESLRTLYRKVVTKTAELHAAEENYQRSIELLKRLVAEDPADEHVHQQLMRLLALTGSKYQALKQFEQCSAALRELGIEPEPETIELLKSIKSGRISSQIKPVDGNAHGVVSTPPQLRQLTYQQGSVQAARFGEDEAFIFYSAAWSGNDYQIYRLHKQGKDSIETGQIAAGLFAISRSGELALALGRRFLRGYVSVAMLARQHFAGGVPRPLLESVQWADWVSDKRCLEDGSDRDCIAVVRDVEGRSCLEYPVGNVLYKTGGWISHPRFSPDGKLIAFIDHPTLSDDSGEIAIVDLDGEKRVLSGDWVSAQGLAWTHQGDEIWFTAVREGNARKIFGVTLQGGERLIYQSMGSLTLQDVSAAGSALVTMEKTRIRIISRRADEDRERDLSWHDWSLVRDLSEDGNLILLTEAGESGGSAYTTYVRDTLGSPAMEIGSGSALAFSPDAKIALVRPPSSPPRLALLPVGAGEAKPLAPAPTDSFFYQPWACFFPDGRRVLFAANEKDKGTRLYVQDLAGEPECITPDEEGVEISSPHSISPDGTKVAIIDSESRVCLYDLEKKSCSPVKNLGKDHLVVRWSGDGRYLFVRPRGKVPATIYRYDLETGEMEPRQQLMPQDPTGVHEILRVLLTPDGRTACAYSYTRELSDLYLIEGLR